MLYYFIIIISSLNNLIFIILKHPMSMMLTLLMQTIYISTISGMMSKTFWFSYILLLIFLGGMLVIFIYISSLASNEMFNWSMMYMLLLLLLLFMSLMFIYLNKPLIMNLNNMETTMFNQSILLKENTIDLLKLYNYPTNLITIMLMMYLLISMIASVKITKFFKGPLRQMFN